MFIVHPNTKRTTERQPIGRKSIIDAVAFDPAGKSITAVSPERTAFLWNLETLKLQRREIKWPEILERAAPLNSDTARNLWNIDPSMLPDRAVSFGVAAVSPDGSLVALRGLNHTLLIWDTTARKVQSTLPDADIAWGDAYFSSDNRFLAISSDNLLIRLYDVHAGSIWKEMSIEIAGEGLHPAVHFAFSPDGRMLASGHVSGAIVLWDIRTGKRRRMLWAHGDGISALSFSPDGKTLAIGTAYDARVWLKSLGRGGREIALVGHTSDIRSADYSPDGTRVATGAADGTVRIWNSSDGTLLATLLALPNEEWIIYTPEGYYSASEGAGQYFLWQDGTDLLPAATFASTYHKPNEVKEAIFQTIKS